jgi:uncharacterized protein
MGFQVILCPDAGVLGVSSPRRIGRNVVLYRNGSERGAVRRLGRESDTLGKNIQAIRVPIVRYRWNFDSVKNKEWLNSSPAVSRWFDAYTLLVPENEAFFIRTLAPCLSRTENDSEAKELTRFFRQESLHGIAHKAYSRRMLELGFRVDRFVNCTNWVLYCLLEPIQPHRLRVSVVAAIEHINASLAHTVLKKDLLRDANEELKRLYYWHFSEEIEHKAVAHKALNRCYPGYITRMLGAAIAFPSFFFLTFVGMTYFLLQDHKCFHAQTFRDVYRFWIGNGVLKETFYHTRRYLRVSFDPWDLDDADLAGTGRSLAASHT